MFKKLAVLTALLCTAPVFAQSYVAPPSFSLTNKVADQLIIVPRVMDVGVGHQSPYEVFAIYSSTRAFVAIMPSKVAAAQYSRRLISQGMYSDYRFAKYEDYAKYETH